MNLTLTDLLTPAQINQAETDIGIVLLGLTCEENREITLIHVLYEERRRAARRDVILRALQAPEEASEVLGGDTGIDDLPDCAFEEEQEAQGVPASQEPQEGLGVPVPPAPSEPILHSPYEEQPPCIQTPTPKHMEVEELVKPNPYLPTIPRYTTQQLATALGVHNSSVGNWIKYGWVTALPGHTKPMLFEVEDIEALREELAAKRHARHQAGAEALARYKAGQMDKSSSEFLTGLILGAKRDFRQGFFVAYSAVENACGAFKYPAALALPAGWAVVSIVEPKADGKKWSASNPMTARHEPLATPNERVRDIVMGPRKAGVE